MMNTIDAGFHKLKTPTHLRTITLQQLLGPNLDLQPDTSRGYGYGTFFGMLFQNQVNPFLFDAEYCSEQESAKKMNVRLLFFCVDHF